LVVYGDMHFLHRPEGPFPTMVSLLESAAAIKVFTIWTHVAGGDLRTLQSDAASWPVPSLAHVPGTVLGQADFTFYYPFELAPPPRNGEPAPVVRSPRMEDEFDAVLYLGPRSAMTRTRLSPALCADAAYIEMRIARMAFAPQSQSQIRQLKEYCADATRK